MGKASVAGICREFLEKAGCEVSLYVLHAQCKIAGLEVTEAQVLAGLRVMASQGKIGKGSDTKSFVPLKLTTASVKLAPVEKPMPITVEKPKRVSKKSADTAVILSEIETKWGPPIAKPSDKSSSHFWLLGDTTVAEIITAAQERYGTKKLAWFTQLAGPTTVLCILEK